MRIDHHAYQRATRVASFGLAMQFIIALTLMLFSYLVGGGDDTIGFASNYAWLGIPVWLGLIIVFHQHKLERLEALEYDELAALRGDESSGGGAGSGLSGASIFDRTDEEIRVAGRRLRLMHTWLMPILSFLLASFLAVWGWVMLQKMLEWGSPMIREAIPQDKNAAIFEFTKTTALGWAVALCLSFAAISFIISRFVAGMAKQEAWQNLRGGAGWMVGNALVLLAVAVGVIFRFFENDAVIETVGYAIPIFMIALSVEIGGNLILNFYRPRVPGEAPRPAFDSRVLSMFAAPDNLVRSLNEAVNYQFGFDVTSTWGYQLLLRSFAGLMGIGLAAIVLLNMMVVVEPHQQAVRLRGGAVVGQVHGSGIMWKLPWPIETAGVYDAHRVQRLALTAQRLRKNKAGQEKLINLWTDELETGGLSNLKFEPFIVRSIATGKDRSTESEGEENSVSDLLALANLEVTLDYHVKLGDDPAKGGLLDYLNFAPDTYIRGQRLTERERMLRHLAVAEIDQVLISLGLDEVLELQEGGLAEQFKSRIQDAFDRNRTGVEVLVVNILMARPAGAMTTTEYLELPVSEQTRQTRILRANQSVRLRQTTLVGDMDLIEPVLQGIDEYERLRHLEDETSQADAARKRVEVERLLSRGGGEAAQIIARAETDRWVSIMKARGDANRVRGEIAAYRAAPRLYRQQLLMSVYMRAIPPVRKFIIGFDPEKLSIDTDIRDVRSTLSLLDAKDKSEKAAEDQP